MDGDKVLDTAFDDPASLDDEVAMLLFALERARAQFAWKCGGLDAAGLNRPHPPSTMTLGGLLKHVTLCEERTTTFALAGAPLPAPWDAAARTSEPGWEWRSAADDAPEELYALWRTAVERSRSTWATALAEGGLDQPVRSSPTSAERPNLRRVLIDLIEHYIRHTGHADLMREAVDGLVGEDPPRS